MAKCRSCGDRAGFGYDECSPCYEKRIKIAEAEAEKKSAEDAAQFEAMVAQKVNDWESSAKQKLLKGEKVFLYQSIYVTVDSLSDGQPINVFNFAPVAKAGLEGWEIRAVIPKTSGFGLKNGVKDGWGNVTETWGGGIGGLVVAVYVILSKEIKSLTYPDNVAIRKIAESIVRRGLDLNA